MDAAQVRAIVPIGEFIPVPNSRAGVVGVVALTSGTAVVVDLRERLHLAVASPGPNRRVVVVEASEGRLAGFVVDRVSDVIRYRTRDLRNGILYGSGRARRVVEVGDVVYEDDLAGLWSVGD